MQKKTQNLVLAILCLLACVSLIQGIRNGIIYSQDFQWDAARALVEKADPYAISLNKSAEVKSEKLDAFYRLFTDMGLKQKMEANQFPSLLLLLVPYVFMTPLTARYAWLLSNLIFTVGIMKLLRVTFLKDMEIFEYRVLMLLMIAGTPYRNQIGVGQHTLFAFAFFLLAVWFGEKKGAKSRILCALSLFVCYFKYTLTIPLVLYFIYKKRYAEVAASLLMQVAVNGLCALWLGKSFLYVFRAPMEVAGRLSAEGGLDLGALTGGGKVANLLALFVLVFLIYLSVKLPKDREAILFPVLLLWSLIMVYHRTYDFFVLVLVPMIFQAPEEAFRDEREKQITKVAFYLLLILVFFVLRLFDENTVSKVLVGTVYYGFTLWVSFLALLNSKVHKV